MRFAIVYGILVALALATCAVPMPSNTVYLSPLSRGVATDPALAASRAKRKAQAAAFERVRQSLLRTRGMKRKLAFPRFDTFVTTNTPTVRARGMRDAAGAFTFTFTGWTAGEEAALRGFLLDTNRAYNTLVSLYGPPALNTRVHIVRDDALADAMGGEVQYDAGSGEITIRMEAVPDDFTTGDYRLYGLDLLQLLLHAFRLPNPLAFDAWEDGMARAVAIIAMMQIRPTVEQFDPVTIYNYLLPTYDCLNAPELSTRTFFPQNGVAMMQVFRTGMALSAWMKVYTEKPGVFREFNAAYYTQVALNPALAADFEALKLLMTTVVSTQIEGLDFTDWYNRQYVLQPTVAIGPHLYLSFTPLADTVVLMANYYTTSIVAGPGGEQVNETPLGATAQFTYTSWDGLDITKMPMEGYTAAIPAAGDSAGTGRISPLFMNIGGPQRIQILCMVNGEQRLINYSYGVMGSDESRNHFFGVLDSADTGTMRVALDANEAYTQPVNQGVFSLKLPQAGMLTYFAPITFTHTAADGKQTVLKRNVGPGFYVVQGAVAMNQQFSTRRTFPAGLSLVSFPLTPDQTDSALLFYPNGGFVDFKFAWWDPAAPGEDKYRVYPALDRIITGRGYWLFLPQQTNIELAGLLPASDDPRVMTLQPGWNLIGNTYLTALNPWGLTVISGSRSYKLTDAVRQGGIIGPVWMYNAQKASFEARPDWQSWEGAWVNNLTGGPLTLKQSGTPRALSTATARGGKDEMLRLLTDGGWGLGIRASINAVQDTACYLGVNPMAPRGVNGLCWLKPPGPKEGVRAAFTHPDRRIAGAQYASDIRAMVGLTGETWEFDVTSGQAGMLTLHWPDMRGIPEQLSVMLEDTATGERRNMRTTPAYVYQSNGNAQQADARRFRVTVAPQTGAPLMVTALNFVTTRGKGVTADFTLNQDADATLEVRSMTGQLLKTLTAHNCAANQRAMLTWDGSMANGGRATPGFYLFVLTARTADGTLARRTGQGRLE